MKLVFFHVLAHYVSNGQIKIQIYCCRLPYSICRGKYLPFTATCGKIIMYNKHIYNIFISFVLSTLCALWFSFERKKLSALMSWFVRKKVFLWNGRKEVQKDFLKQTFCLNEWLLYYCSLPPLIVVLKSEIKV